MISATILGLSGPELTGPEFSLFRQAQPWGFILFARNIESPQQLARLTASLREAVGRDAPVLIDQEGGRVQRMRAPHWAEWLPPRDQVRAVAAKGGDAARSVWLRYALIGAELRAVGVDANCAPTLDIARPETHPFLQNRCFGDDLKTVVRMGRACADGLLAAGVLPVMKHMPGHGRAIADSHHDLPRVSALVDDLRASDFAAFAALRDLPMGMTSHIVYDALDDTPATASARMIGLIRDEIGFDGLLMTDDISMNALSGTLAQRSAAAIAAGCDVVLYCHGDMAEMEAIVPAAGPMSAAALERGERALALRRAPALDLAQARAEFDALIA